MKKTGVIILLMWAVACSSGKTTNGKDAKQADIQEGLTLDIGDVYVGADDGSVVTDDGNVVTDDGSVVTDDVTDVTNEVTDVQNEVIDVQNDISDVQKDIIDVQNEVSDVQNEVIDVQNEVSDVQNEVSDVQNEASDDTNEVTDAPNDVTDLTNEVTDVQNEVQDVQNEVTDAQNEVLDAQNEVLDVQNDISSNDVTQEVVVHTCVASKGSTDLTLIRGNVVSGDDLIKDGEVLFSADTHKILCVGNWGDCEATANETPTIICANGMIYPGLVDSHNHNQYNFMPRWRHDGLFQDRYQWQATPSYHTFKHSYNAINSDHICAMMRYSEIRELMAGTTSTIGSTGGSCIDGLVRNLEENAAANGINESGIRYTSQKISGINAGSIANGLKDGSIEAYLIHLAEGVDESSFGEWATLKADGLLQSGTAIIHGTALRTEQFVEMLGAGAKLIWSPRSNIDLYGLTTPAIIAIHLGLVVALAPDWVPSGSLNMLEEMKCADHVDNTFLGDQLTPKDLFKMVTIRGAQACHVEDKLGLLNPGYYADVTVISGDTDKPYQTLLNAGPADIRAVFIGGGFVYGDTDIWDLFAGREPYDWCEDITVCTAAKKLCVKRSATATAPLGKTFAQVKDQLTNALTTARQADSAWDANNPDATYEYDLSPLFHCDRSKVSDPCVLGNVQYPWQPKDGDVDGDGVPDATDNCPAVFNPRQWDTDNDTVGDMCDKCPVSPGEDCQPGTPDDPDQDGVTVADDNCPFVYNQGQEDRDKDGKGDACDLCPDEPNPGSEPCSFTIQQIRDPNTPPKVEHGSVVKVSGPIVTAITPTTSKYKGFYIQEPDGTDYSALYVFVGTDMPQGIAVGNAVTVQGTVVDFFGLDEIKDPTYSVVNPNPDQNITPVVVDPADVADGGSRSEALEGVLIEVDNVNVVKENPDAPKDYKECELTGGLRMDDALFDYTSLGIRHEGQCLKKVVGILVYSFSHYKILPRSADDITICQGAE